MNKDKAKSRHKSEVLTSLYNNKNLISGIYNYCDRWCERCHFTERCNLYRIEKEEGLSGSNEISMKDSLNRVSNIFALTMDMLNQMAGEYGIDLNNLQELELPKHIPGALEKLATDYGHDVFKWINKNHNFFNHQIDIYSSIDENISKMIVEVIQIISWYGPLIGAKIHRSMYGEIDADETERYDKLGSAKIALISIERSIGAFSFILFNLPDKEDESLDFLVTLAKIKRLLEDIYPDAMSFKRPGFDD